MCNMNARVKAYRTGKKALMGVVCSVHYKSIC